MKHFQFVFGVSLGLLIGVILMSALMHQKLQSAKEVINIAIEDNPDYYLDVLCETDAWYNYSK